MVRYLVTALRMALLTMLLVGVIYPLLITGIAQLLFPYQANGSLIRNGNTVQGAVLIGQSFTSARYFHPRPSAAGIGYDALASGGSNLGPTSKALHDRVAADMQRVRAENPGLDAVPADMVTASASGLDPDITLANALAQLPRVAHARGLSRTAVHRLVYLHLTRRQFYLLGEPRINVLQLNRTLDALQGTTTR